MSDRLAAIEASMNRGSVLNTENGCSVANITPSEASWLLAEVRRIATAEAMERSIVDILTAAIGEQDMTAAQGVKMLADRCTTAEAEVKRLETEHAECVQSVAKEAYAQGKQDAEAEAARLREQHAEAVKAAYIEGRNSDEFDDADERICDEDSWWESMARKGVTP